MSDSCFQCGKTLPLTKGPDSYLYFCGDDCRDAFYQRYRSSLPTSSMSVFSLKTGAPPAVSDALVMLDRRCDGNEQAEQALDVLREYVQTGLSDEC